MAAAGRVQGPGPRPTLGREHRACAHCACAPPTPSCPARTPPTAGVGPVKQPRGERFSGDCVFQSLLAPVHSLSTEGSFPLLLNPAQSRPGGSTDTGSRTLVEAPLEWVDNMRVPNSGFAWGSFLGFIFLIFSIRGWLAAGGEGSFPGC